MTFDEWIAHVFDPPVRQPYWEGMPPDWDGPDDVIIGDMTRLLAQAETILNPFSAAQAAQGLWTMVSQDCSDYPLLLTDMSEPVRAWLDCIEAMKTLFRHCFAPLCPPHLSHLDTPETPGHVSPLNGVCFLWWDILPLYGLPRHRPDLADGPTLDRAVLSVIRRCLEIDAIACQESVLLGLMTWSLYSDEPRAIAEDFLRRSANVRPELRAFAWRVG